MKGRSVIHAAESLPITGAHIRAFKADRKPKIARVAFSTYPEHDVFRPSGLMGAGSVVGESWGLAELPQDLLRMLDVRVG